MAFLHSRRMRVFASRFELWTTPAPRKPRNEKRNRPQGWGQRPAPNSYQKRTKVAQNCGRVKDWYANNPGCGKKGLKADSSMKKEPAVEGHANATAAGPSL